MVETLDIVFYIASAVADGEGGVFVALYILLPIVIAAALLGKQSHARTHLARKGSAI